MMLPDEIASQETPAQERADTGRLEAFSDGVFAVAITLLALNIHVPTTAELRAQHVQLLGALLQQWPIYLAYVMSFTFILIMWINHHTMFRLIARCDHTLLILNGLLLLAVVVVPFSTALLADYVVSPTLGDQRTAAAVFSGVYLVIAVLFNAVWLYAAHEHRLIDPHVPRRAVEARTRGYRFGPLLYLIAFAAAFISVPVSLGINITLALYFALPPTGLWNTPRQTSAP
jgi:uncharacterized membrane protein